MKRLSALKRISSTIRFRLLVAIGLILLVCQIVSVVWLWHESKEQISLLVDAAVHNHDRHQHVEKEIHEAVASLAVPSLIVLVMTLLICYQAVKWITRPLYQLQHHLENRRDDDLDPINFHSSINEVDAVTLAINQLVSRLTTSIERERMFTADVAHELRTPLAGLRLHLELIEKKHNINVLPLLQRLDRMTNSISQLLQLARVGQSFTAGNYQNVMLNHDVMAAMEHELGAMLAQRQQRLKMDIAEEVVVRGDATLLRVLLRNLVENAHRYSPEGTVITLRLEKQQPMMAVEDEGPGIDTGKSGELTKAFVRMDSRYGGIGLGLSIVTRIAQLHQAQFFLENHRERSGCSARITFTSGG